MRGYILNNDKHRYDDIINLPHHRSDIHPHISMYKRAAQFTPFAALTGHDEAIKETARYTENKRELSDEQKEYLNEKLLIAYENIGSDTVFEFTYFVPDKKKSGGEYISHAGKIKNIDRILGLITLTDHTIIEIAQVYKVHSDIFKGYGVDE